MKATVLQQGRVVHHVDRGPDDAELDERHELGLPDSKDVVLVLREPLSHGALLAVGLKLGREPLEGGKENLGVTLEVQRTSPNGFDT